MPRKRATRLQQAAKPKPTNMTVADSMSSKERTEQLEVFLRDYDSRVKNVLKNIEKKKRTLLTFIQTRFEKHISDLPRSIKELTVEEFASYGGSIEAALAHTNGPVENPMSKKMADILNLKWTEQPLEDITEEGNDTSELPASVIPTGTRPKRLQGKTANRTARAGNKSLLKTPSSTATHPMWGQTPLFTPKFDTSIPMTSVKTRGTKPGEILVSMAGSPVHADKSETVCGSDVNDKITKKLYNINGLTPGRIEEILKVISDTVNQ